MSYENNMNEVNEGFHYSFMNVNDNYNFLADTNGMTSCDENHLSQRSPRTESPSPSGVSSYQVYSPMSYGQHEHRNISYNTEYEYANSTTPVHPPFVRIVKRRTTANKKERRRTQSINMAYSDLRDCIPLVPSDTKLSKIKTLRLATSYISYLTGVLETDEPGCGFRAELGALSKKTSHNNHQIHLNECTTVHQSTKSEIEEMNSASKRSKGRTGWPQHVWALELKQEQNL